MVSQEHIDDFSPILKEILNNEIDLGNEIIETSICWPKKESIIIILKAPFIQDYKKEFIKYRNINDNRYWKAEYFDEKTSHTLACKF